jgi:uncharacterized phage-associated protein
MLISHDREKLIEAIVYFAKNTKLCGKTKLMKLLYFLDFFHFRQTGRSVTGLDYYAWDYGAVPRDVWRELEDPESVPNDLSQAIAILPVETIGGKALQRIVTRRKFDPEHFSPRELLIMKNLAEIFEEADADQMIESAHLPGEPWDSTCREKGMHQRIDYMLGVGGTPDSLPEDVIMERQEEIRGMLEFVGDA